MQAQIKPTETELVNFQTAIKAVREGKRARRLAWSKNDFLSFQQLGGKEIFICNTVNPNGKEGKRFLVIDLDIGATDWFIH